MRYPNWKKRRLYVLTFRIWHRSINWMDFALYCSYLKISVNRFVSNTFNSTNEVWFLILINRVKFCRFFDLSVCRLYWNQVDRLFARMQRWQQISLNLCLRCLRCLNVRFRVVKKTLIIWSWSYIGDKFRWVLHTHFVSLLNRR